MSDYGLIKITKPAMVWGRLESGEEVHISLVPSQVIRLEVLASSEVSFQEKRLRIKILLAVGGHETGEIVMVPAFQAESWVERGLAKEVK